MDPLDPIAHRRAQRRFWAAHARTSTMAATPATMEAARVQAQASAESSARARLADYATALLNRRLAVPAPVPFTPWMV